MCPTVMYRRADLRTPPFSATLRQVVDLDLYLDALFARRVIVGTRTIGYRYRRHVSSTTKLLSEDGARFREEVELYLWTAERAEQCSFALTAFMARLMPLVRINLAFSIACDIVGGRFAPVPRKFRLLVVWSKASLEPPQKSVV